MFEEDRTVASVTDVASPSAVGSPSSVGQAAAAAPVAAAKAAASRTPRAPGRHVFDMLLDGLRARFTAAFVEKTAKAFRAAGSYGLFLAMLLVAAFTVITTVKSRGPNDIPLGVAVILVLAVLQYAAGKFCDVLEQLNRTTTSSLASTAFPDFCALQSLAVGLAFLIGSPVTTVSGAMHSAMGSEWTILAGVGGFFFGLLMFIVCGYLAVVAVNLAALNISIAPEALRRRRSDRRNRIRAQGVAPSGAGVVRGGRALRHDLDGIRLLPGVLRQGRLRGNAARYRCPRGLPPDPALVCRVTGGRLSHVRVLLPRNRLALCAFLILPGKIDQLAARNEEQKIGQ